MGKNIIDSINSLARMTTIIFVALRACDVTDWAWYWVLSPTIFAIITAILLLAVKGASNAADDSD